MSGSRLRSSPRRQALVGTGEVSRRRAQERLRRRYRPDTIDILFVGESPPASGRFFYRQDSGLYRAVFDTFRSVEPTIESVSFLSVFARAGCYLVDLCADPVDRLDTTSRRAACVAGEASLAATISRLKPRTIISVVRSIEDNVSRAANRACWSGEFLRLPYPGRWKHWHAAFSDGLAPSIHALLMKDRGRWTAIDGAARSCRS